MDMSSSELARAMVFKADDDTNHVDIMSPVSSPSTIADLRKTQRSIKRLASHFRLTEEKRSNLQLELEKMLNDRNVKLAAIESMSKARAVQRFQRIQKRSIIDVINAWRISAELRMYGLRKICLVMQGIKNTEMGKLRSTILLSWKHISSRLARRKYSESLSRPWMFLPTWRRWLQSWRIGRFERQARTSALRRAVLLWSVSHRSNARLDRLLDRANKGAQRRLSNQVFSKWFAITRTVRTHSKRVKSLLLKTYHNVSKVVWIVWCEAVRDGLRIQEKLELRFVRTRHVEYKRRSFQILVENALSQRRLDLCANRSIRKQHERYWNQYFGCWKGITRNQKVVRCKEQSLFHRISRSVLRKSADAWRLKTAIAKRNSRTCRHIKNSIRGYLVGSSFRVWGERVRRKIWKLKHLTRCIDGISLHTLKSAFRIVYEYATYRRRVLVKVKTRLRLITASECKRIFSKWIVFSQNEKRKKKIIARMLIRSQKYMLNCILNHLCFEMQRARRTRRILGNVSYQWYCKFKIMVWVAFRTECQRNLRARGLRQAVKRNFLRRTYLIWNYYTEQSSTYQRTIGRRDEHRKRMHLTAMFELFTLHAIDQHKQRDTVKMYENAWNAWTAGMKQKVAENFASQSQRRLIYGLISAFFQGLVIILETRSKAKNTARMLYDRNKKSNLRSILQGWALSSQKRPSQLHLAGKLIDSYRKRMLNFTCLFWSNKVKSQKKVASKKLQKKKSIIESQFRKWTSMTARCRLLLIQRSKLELKTVYTNSRRHFLAWAASVGLMTQLKKNMACICIMHCNILKRRTIEIWLIIVHQCKRMDSVKSKALWSWLFRPEAKVLRIWQKATTNIKKVKWMLVRILTRSNQNSSLSTLTAWSEKTKRKRKQLSIIFSAERRKISIALKTILFHWYHSAMTQARRQKLTSMSQTRLLRAKLSLVLLVWNSEADLERRLRQLIVKRRKSELKATWQRMHNHADKLKITRALLVRFGFLLRTKLQNRILRFWSKSAASQKQLARKHIIAMRRYLLRSADTWFEEWRYRVKYRQRRSAIQSRISDKTISKIMSSVFVAWQHGFAYIKWKKRSKIFAQRSMENRVLSKSTKSWIISCSNSLNQRRKLGKALGSYAVSLLSKVIAEWSMRFKKSKTCFLKQLKFISSQGKSIVQRAWLQWLIYYKYLRTLTRAYVNKQTSYRKKSTAFYFRIWITYSTRQQRNKNCLNRCRDKIAASALPFALQQWYRTAKLAITMRRSIAMALFRQVRVLQSWVLDSWRAWARKQRMYTTRKSRIGSRRIAVLLVAWNIAAKRRRRSKFVVLRALLDHGNKSIRCWFDVWNENIKRQRRNAKLATRLNTLARQHSMDSAFMIWLQHHRNRCSFLSLLLQLRRKMAINLLLWGFKTLKYYFRIKRRLGSIFLSVARNTMHRYFKRTFGTWNLNVVVIRRWKRHMIMVMQRNSQNIIRMCFDFWQIHNRGKRALCSKQGKLVARRIYFGIRFVLEKWKEISSFRVCMQRNFAFAVRITNVKSRRSAFSFWQLKTQDLRRERTIIFRTICRMKAVTTGSAFASWRSNSTRNAQIRFRSERSKIRLSLGLIEQSWHVWKKQCWRGRRMLRLLLNIKCSNALRRMSLGLAAFAVCLSYRALSDGILNLVMQRQKNWRIRQCVADWLEISRTQKEYGQQYAAASDKKLMAMLIRCWSRIIRRRRAIFTTSSRFLLCMFGNMLERFWHRWRFEKIRIKADAEKMSFYQNRVNTVSKSNTFHKWTKQVMEKVKERRICKRFSCKSKAMTLVCTLQEWKDKVKWAVKVRRFLKAALLRQCKLSQWSVLYVWRSWACKKAMYRSKLTKLEMRLKSVYSHFALEKWIVTTKEQRREKDLAVRVMRMCGRNAALQYFGIWSIKVQRQARYRKVIATQARRERLFVLRKTWGSWEACCRQASSTFRHQSRLQSSTKFKSISRIVTAWSALATAQHKTEYRLRRMITLQKRTILHAFIESWHIRCSRFSKNNQRVALLLRKKVTGLLQRALMGWRGSEIILRGQVPISSAGLTWTLALTRQKQIRAISRWKAFALTRSQRRSVLSKALSKSNYVCCSASYSRWVGNSTKLRRCRTLLSRTIKRMQCIALSRALSTWKHLAKVLSMLRQHMASMRNHKMQGLQRKMLSELNMQCKARHRKRRALLRLCEIQRLRSLRRVFDLLALAVSISHYRDASAVTAARRTQKNAHLKVWAGWRVAANEQRCSRLWRRASDGRKAAGLLLAAWDGAAKLAAWDCLRANASQVRARRLAITRRAERRRGRALFLSLRCFRANAVLGVRLAGLAVRLLRRGMVRSCRLWRFAVALGQAVRRRAEAVRRRRLCGISSAGWRRWSKAVEERRRLRALERLAGCRLRRIRLSRAFVAWRDTMRRSRMVLWAMVTGARRHSGALRLRAWRWWSDEVRRRAAESALEEQREELGRVAALVRRFASVSHETIALCDGAAASVDAVPEYDAGPVGGRGCSP